MESTKKQQLARLNQYAHNTIPLLQYMQIRFTELENNQLRADMPLAPNINDKQTGFAGSIATLATISGWGLITLLLQSNHQHLEVLVTGSDIHYLAPATDNLYALASVDTANRAVFNQALAQRQSSKIAVQVNVMQQDKKVAVYSGVYIARPKKRMSLERQTADICYQ